MEKQNEDDDFVSVQISCDLMERFIDAASNLAVHSKLKKPIKVDQNKLVNYVFLSGVQGLEYSIKRQVMNPRLRMTLTGTYKR